LKAGEVFVSGPAFHEQYPAKTLKEVTDESVLIETGQKKKEDSFLKDLFWIKVWVLPDSCLTGGYQFFLASSRFGGDLVCSLSDVPARSSKDIPTSLKSAITVCFARSNASFIVPKLEPYQNYELLCIVIPGAVTSYQVLLGQVLVYRELD
jgi:hypothetical protein